MVNNQRGREKERKDLLLVNNQRGKGIERKDFEIKSKFYLYHLKCVNVNTFQTAKGAQREAGE